MDIKKFVLTYYSNAADGIHIQRLKKSEEAQIPHTHEYFQIYYVVKGSLVHLTENDKSTLSQGDMFIIPPGKTHYIRDLKNVEFYSFSFMRGSLGEISDVSRLPLNFLINLTQGDNIRAKISLSSDEAMFVENLMAQMHREFEDRKIGCSEIIKSCAISLVAVLARNYFSVKPEELISPDAREYILHCVEYIKNNFSEKLTLDEMAQRSAMSKSCFCKLFMEITGTSFNKFVNACRIRKAAEYINKGYKITAVYGMCGYEDFSTFYRNFVKVMGVNPNKYKSR